MDNYLQLSGGVGRGQDNDQEDVAATDGALREIGAYVPPPEYAGEPQRFTTEPMVDALTGFQEQNGLKVDGYTLPGGPTERAINNRLQRKPRGAGLLHDFDMQIGDTVGNGFRNEPRDVKTVKRALGGLGYLPEDPFDDPSGFIEESTTSKIRKFQEDHGLGVDGWLRPGGETESAMNDAVNRVRRSSSAIWRDYWRRAPSKFAGDGDGNFDDAAESTLGLAQHLFQQDDPGNARIPDAPGLVTKLGQQPIDRGASDQSRPAATPGEKRAAQEGIGSVSFDPEGNFGSWAFKRSDVLPEGVEPPTDPLKPDVLGGVPFEGSTENDVGTDSKREVRWLISRLYRIGAQDERGNYRVSDETFAEYLDKAKQYIKPEHYPVFELTARAVRAGVLDSEAASTRLAAYLAPETTGETVVDLLLDLAPIVSQLKAAKDAHSAIEDALDAATFGDERAHAAAIAKAALAIAALVMPGVGAGAKKLLAKSLGQELHHLIPIYLGGRRSAPLLETPPGAHREAANSIHRLMQEFFATYYPGLVHSSKSSGKIIVRKVEQEKRLAALDAFYRSLEKSYVAHHRTAHQAWLKIFPEAEKYFRR